MRKSRITAMLLAGVMCLSSAFTGVNTVNAAEAGQISEIGRAHV